MRLWTLTALSVFTVTAATALFIFAVVKTFEAMNDRKYSTDKAEISSRDARTFYKCAIICYIIAIVANGINEILEKLC